MSESLLGAVGQGCVSSSTFTVERPSIGVGCHAVVLEGATQVDGRFGQPAMEFRFASLDGKAIATKVVGCRLASSNSFGAVVAKMLGCPLTVGEEIDLTQLVGQRFAVVIGETGIESIVPAPEKPVPKKEPALE